MKMTLEFIEIGDGNFPEVNREIFVITPKEFWVETYSGDFLPYDATHFAYINFNELER